MFICSSTGLVERFVLANMFVMIQQDLWLGVFLGMDLYLLILFTNIIISYYKLTLAVH